MKKKNVLMILAALAAAAMGSFAYADEVPGTPTEPVDPAGYVELTAGSTYELAIDENNLVIDVTVLQEEPVATEPTDPTAPAEEPAPDLTGMPVDEAAAALVEDAINDGSLGEGEAVEIVVVTEDGQDTTGLEDAIGDAIEETTTDEEVPVPVVFQNAAQERIALARELGITPGKLNLIQKYAASTGAPEGVDVTLWTDKSVKEIMSAIKVNRKNGPAVTEPGDGSEDQPADETTDASVQAAAAETVTAAPAPEKVKGNSGSKGGSSKGKGKK